MAYDIPVRWSPAGPRVGEVGEEAILELLVAPTPKTWLPVPNGDDAAVLAPEQQLVAMSVDAVLEHQHFERSWVSPSQLGVRAIYVSASDIAAMGVIPKWCLLSLQIPPELPFQALKELVEGIQSVCDLEEIVVIGGNLTRATSLGLHITVGGFAARDRSPLTRSGAGDGDFLWLTGNLGRAASGRALLQSPYSENPRGRALVDAWRRPPQRWSLMGRLGEDCILHAAIDISDGLWIDARRMATASDLSIFFDLDAFGLDEDLIWAGEALEESPLSWALTGGEDYEVLVAAPEPPPPWAQRLGVRVVGRLSAGPPSVEFLRDNAKWQPDFPISGWDPFSSS